MKRLLLLLLVACKEAESPQANEDRPQVATAESRSRDAGADVFAVIESMSKALDGGAVMDASIDALPPTGGLAAEEIRRVVVAHQGALRACYDKVVEKDPSIRGGVTAGWNIDRSGSVTSATIVSETVGHGVPECVLRQIRTWKFPEAERPTSVAQFPFKFGIAVQ